MAFNPLRQGDFEFNARMESFLSRMAGEDFCFVDSGIYRKESI